MRTFVVYSFYFYICFVFIFYIANGALSLGHTTMSNRHRGTWVICESESCSCYISVGIARKCGKNMAH